MMGRNSCGLQAALPAPAQPPALVGGGAPWAGSGSRPRTGRAGAGSSAAARERAWGRCGGMGWLRARRLALLAACLGLCGERGALGGTCPPTSPPRPFPGRPRAEPARRGGARAGGSGGVDSPVLRGPRETPRPGEPYGDRDLDSQAGPSGSRGRGPLGSEQCLWLLRGKLGDSRPARPGPSGPDQFASLGGGPCADLGTAFAADWGFQGRTLGVPRTGRRKASCCPPFSSFSAPTRALSRLHVTVTGALNSSPKFLGGWPVVP